MRTLEEMMSELPPERRKEIEARTKVLIAEEMARQKRRKAKKAGRILWLGKCNGLPWEWVRCACGCAQACGSKVHA